MKYIVENWFVIVGLIAVCAAGGYAVYVFVKMPSDKQLNKGHHSAGKNEGDSHLRRFTQYQTFGSVGQ